LEKAIRESESGIADLVKDLRSAMDRQIRTIQAALAVNGTDRMRPSSARPAEARQALTAIARLKELLEASDADACEAYRNLAVLLRGMVDASRLEKLGAAVESFDFDAALSRLGEVAKEFGEKEPE